MPGSHNIEQPLVIVGAGRSGTTWLLSLLWRHPEVQAIVDNTLIGGVYRETYSKWWAKAFLKSQCENDPEKMDERVVDGLRALICTMFPGDRPHWVMKSIWDSTKDALGGVPNDFRIKLFPRARYLHMVRDPRTSIPSMLEYFGGRGGKLDTLERCEDAYCSANLDAMRMRDAGMPYLLIRQEDVRKDAEKSWRTIEEFAGYAPHDFRSDVVDREVNASKSMVGRVREGREPLRWDQLSEQTREIAASIGYAAE